MYHCRTIVLSVLLVMMLAKMGLAAKLTPIAVTATSSYPGNPPSAAVDGNSSTLWNAGAFPQQYIQLDLGHTVSLRKIRLQISQSPSGTSTHTISVGTDTSSLRTAFTINQNMSDGQWVEFNGDGFNGDKLGNIRYVRITTTASPSWVGWREIELYGGIDYLGYWGDAIAWASGNVMDQTVAAGSNLVWIGPDTTSDLANKLAQASQLGAKAIIDPQYILYTHQDETPPNTLRSNWQTLWSNIANTIKTSAHPEVVAAFYLFDEPTNNGISASSIAQVSNQMVVDFPSTPKALIFDWGSVANNAFVPYLPYVQWAGFDCYGRWSTCETTNIPALISNLRSHLSNTQRMIAVPWTFVPYAGITDTGPAGQNYIIEQNLNYWQHEIAGDGKYVALAPFIWSTPDSSSGAGELVWPGDTASTLGLAERMYQMAYSFLPSPTAGQVFPTSYAASSTYSNWYPFAAFDRQVGTTWSSGSYPTASVGAYFDGSTHIKRIRLVVAQNPVGPTTTRIWGLQTPATAYGLIATINQTTHDGDVIDITNLNVNIDTVRIETTVGPSWVGWRDIQFFAQ